MWESSVNWMADGTSVLSEPAGRSSVGFVNDAILISVFGASLAKMTPTLD